MSEEPKNPVNGGTQRRVIGVSCITILILCGASDAQAGRRADLTARLRAETTALPSLATTTSADEAATLRVLLTTLDTLLTEYPGDATSPSWRRNRNEYAARRLRCLALLTVDSLLALRRTVPQMSSGRTDLAASADLIVSALSRLQTAEDSTGAFLARYPNDPSTARLRAAADSLAPERSRAESLAFTASLAAIAVIEETASTMCFHIRQLWDVSITLGRDPSVEISKVLRQAEETSGPAFEQGLAAIRRVMGCLRDWGAANPQLHAALQDAYLVSVAHLDLARHPRGSLLTFTKESNEYAAKSTEATRRIQLLSGQ